ncbi:hypothetical protein V8E54_012879 [Elaphomyces granulatus]
MMSLSSKQVEACLDRIALPQEVRDSLLEGGNGSCALWAVTTLQLYHMAAIPHENLDLHYSSHHTVPLEIDIIYESIVIRRRGGTCLQVHQLFSKLLRSLGFQTYNTVARVNAPASIEADLTLDKPNVTYGPWTHLNTIVRIGKRDYVVDPSFYQFGSPFPVPLVHDESVGDAWGRSWRMIHSSIPGWTAGDQKWWRMQYRESENYPWMDVYCLMETEWLPSDFHILTMGIGVTGIGWFFKGVACFRIILEEDIPVGYLLIWQDELRQLYKGQTQVLQKFYNENDRVTALAEEFGILLSEDDQRQIAGTTTELKDESYDFYGYQTPEKPLLL